MKHKNLYYAIHDLFGVWASDNELDEILTATEKDSVNKPFFGWCEVAGCENEAVNGSCWPDTGHWFVCERHSAQFSRGEPQPQMKQSAIEREKLKAQK